MSWQNQLRKAPFGPFKRKKPEQPPTETPEEAKRNKEINFMRDALDIISRANSNDTGEAFFGEQEKIRRTNRLNDKIAEYSHNNWTHMGQEGIEGLKSFIGYLERSADSNAIKEGARQALSYVESKKGELQ